MTHERHLVDRQIGRNAQLLAEEVSALPTAEARFPYLRILVALVEAAHPEWNGSPQKTRQIADVAVLLSRHALDADEVEDVVRVRDEERGLTIDRRGKA